jgi:hypothetical protein
MSEEPTSTDIKESEVEKQTPDNKYTTKKGLCFGEWGSRTFCREGCPYSLTCKTFTNATKKAQKMRYSGKYKGKGKWSRKDVY